MHGSHRQALVSALAEICNLELHTAVGSPGTAGLRSSCESDANSGTGSELAVSAGSACGAAHSELLRLCISALSRAAGPAPSAKPAATGPGASRNAAAAPDGAAAKASAQAAMTVLVAVLEACAGGSARLLADPVASAFYWTLTRALRLLMPEVQLRSLAAHRAPSAVAALALAPASPLHAKSSCHQRWCTMWAFHILQGLMVQHAAPLVTCLRKFLRYGVQPQRLLLGGLSSVPPFGVPTSWPAAKLKQPQGGRAPGAYRPPHQRAPGSDGRAQTSLHKLCSRRGLPTFCS